VAGAHRGKADQGVDAALKSALWLLFPVALLAGVATVILATSGIRSWRTWRVRRRSSSPGS
jgi:hypothetical protein